jgi:hypothetical protein
VTYLSYDEQTKLNRPFHAFTRCRLHQDGLELAITLIKNGTGFMKETWLKGYLDKVTLQGLRGWVQKYNKT